MPNQARHLELEWICRKSGELRNKAREETKAKQRCRNKGKKTQLSKSTRSQAKRRDATSIPRLFFPSLFTRVSSLNGDKPCKPNPQQFSVRAPWFVFGGGCLVLVAAPLPSQHRGLRKGWAGLSSVVLEHTFQCRECWAPRVRP